MNFGAIISENDDKEEQSFLHMNGKKIYDIIYRNAIILHETKKKYDLTVRGETIDEIMKVFPNLEKDYPRLFTQFCCCLDRVSKNKGGMSKVIYGQLVEELKGKKLL